MTRPDLNLLVTLDVLLAEGSVARAARRLRLSPSAMSRALARLRAATGDPLLVRAGRSLVPTPRAAELRDRVGHLVQESEMALRPAGKLDVKALVRRALNYLDPRRMMLAPDCGLVTLSRALARQKLDVMVQAARELRREL